MSGMLVYFIMVLALVLISVYFECTISTINKQSKLLSDDEPVSLFTSFLDASPTSSSSDWLFSSDDYFSSDDHVSHSFSLCEPSINPANGLPMVGSVDIHGNPYGCDFSHDSFHSSDMFDMFSTSSSSSFDDTFSSSSFSSSSMFD